MSGTVAVRETSALAIVPGQTAWTAQQKAALEQIGVAEAPEGDQLVFLNYAQRTGLDPWARQIYMIGRNDRQAGGKRWTIQASIDGLRIVAQRSGEYAGQVGPEWCGEDGVWKDVWLTAKFPVAARVGVLRRGFAQPLYAVALTREYMPTYNDKPTGLWASKPALMIAKCAEALALRKAFPNDLSGIYTAEEMSQADGPAAPTAPRPPAIATRPEQAGRDWLAEAEQLTTVEALTALYREAAALFRDAWESPERVRILGGITRRAEAVKATPVDGEVIQDAEVVDDAPDQSAA